MAWTLDHVGPMCKTVEDAALMLAAIAGYDPLDPTSVDAPVPDYTRAIGMSTAKLRVGVARKPFFDNLNPEVAKAVEAAIDVLRKLTASVTDVDVLPQETSQTFGTRRFTPTTSRSSARRPSCISRRRAISSRAGKTSALTYAQAKRQLDVVRREVKKVFARVDVLVTPTQRGVAQPIAAPSAGTGSCGWDTAARWCGARRRRWRHHQHRGIRYLWFADDLRALGSRRRWVCRSDCKSAATTSPNPPFSRSRTLTSRRPGGIHDGPP